MVHNSILFTVCFSQLKGGKTKSIFKVSLFSLLCILSLLSLLFSYYVFQVYNIVTLQIWWMNIIMLQTLCMFKSRCKMAD